MEKVLVVGAGFMGAGIAQVCAQAGYQVHLSDVKQDVLDRAIKEIKWSVEKLTEKGMLDESSEVVLNRIFLESDLKSAGLANWVIEAAFEKEDLKKEIFQELDRLAPVKTPLATNTSTIPISRIAAVTRAPERVLGLHFFGPVPLMDIVEVVNGVKTSSEVFEQGYAFVKTLGKRPVQVRQDIPGFAMNRIFQAAFREAVDLVDRGIVTPEEVDTGMKLGYGWNAGPFEIGDNAGLDTFLLICRSLKDLGEEGLCPRSDLIERMVEKGSKGRKSGKGFYRYTPDGKKVSASI